MCIVELALQYIVNKSAEILRRGHGIREFRPLIQILQIKAGDNSSLNAFVEIHQIADHAVLVYLPADRDFKHIIVPMPMRIIAFAVCGLVLRVRHLLAMQAMRSRESIAAMEMSFHFNSQTLSFRPNFGLAPPIRSAWRNLLFLCAKLTACKPTGSPSAGSQQVPRLRWSVRRAHGSTPLGMTE